MPRAWTTFRRCTLPARTGCKHGDGLPVGEIRAIHDPERRGLLDNQSNQRRWPATGIAKYDVAICADLPGREGGESMLAFRKPLRGARAAIWRYPWVHGLLEVKKEFNQLHTSHMRVPLPAPGHVKRPGCDAWPFSSRDQGMMTPRAATPRRLPAPPACRPAASRAPASIRGRRPACWLRRWRTAAPPARPPAPAKASASASGCRHRRVRR